MTKPTHGPDGTRLFSRQDIYDIRAFWDAKIEEGWTFSQIAMALSPHYHPASNQTLMRIGKRETFREIGVGGGERSMVSNRLFGEARRTGEPVTLPPTYRIEAEVKDLTEWEMAEAKRKIEVPPLSVNPDGTAKIESPGEAGLEALKRRGSFDEPPDDDGGPTETAEEILARKVKEQS